MIIFNDNDKKMITKIPYFKVERKIESNVQQYLKKEHQLKLYNDSLTTSTHQFNHDSIFDISYKAFSGENGILYLHTDHGVHSFEIDSDPREFIEHVKRYIQ